MTKYDRFMLRLILLWVGCLLLLTLVGCVTPDHWSAETHMGVLRQCSLACGEDRMTGYSAWSAKCECRGRK